MATRFGRRAADGTFEYHDSRESMIVAEGRENNDARAGLFGLIGLLVGGVLTLDLGFHVNDKSSSRVTSRHMPMA